MLASGRPREAADCCLSALAENRDQPGLLLLLGLCEEQLGEEPGARERFRRALKVDPEFCQAHFELARLLLAQRETGEAAAHLRRCVELDPNHAPARTVLARLDRAAGREDAAQQGLKSALRADPDHVPARISLAELLLDHGQLEEASKHASHAIGLEPDNPLAQLIMARVLEAQGRPTFAEQCLRNAIERLPDDPAVRVALAGLLQRAGRHAQTLEQLELASGLGADSAEVNAMRGISLQATGQLQEALASYQLAVDGSSPHRDVLLRYADLLRRVRDPDRLCALLDRHTDLSGFDRQWLETLLAAAAEDWSEVHDRCMTLADCADADIAVQARLLGAETHFERSSALSGKPSIRDWLAPLSAGPVRRPEWIWEAARLCREAADHDVAVDLLRHLERSGLLSEQTRSRTMVMLVDELDRAGQYQEAGQLFDQAAWQRPFLGEPAWLKEPEPLEIPDLAPLREVDWQAAPIDGALPRPVFLLGWPCSGRDLVLMTLAQSPDIVPLSPDTWPQRRETLGLPIRPEHLSVVDDAMLRMKRRRYLRSVSHSSLQTLIEPGAVFPLDLPQLVRVFPNAVVIAMTAAERYLELQWRLAGYRQVPSMRQFWRRDEQLLDSVTEIVPVNLHRVSLSELLQAPGAVLTQLCTRLGLRYDDSLPGIMDELAHSRGYRSPEHWKHYFSD